MKHLFLALGLATAVGTAARAQVTYNLLWDKTHGGSDRDWNAQVSTDGKGFLYVIGDSQTNGNGDKTSFLCTDSAIVADIWLVKTDGTGSIVGQNAYGGYGDERSPHLFHLGNAAGEMIFACQSASDTGCTKSQFNRDTIFPFSTDYWVVKLDSNLNPIWDKTLGGMGFDNLTRITQLTNGNILVCGQSQSGVDGDKTVPNHSLAPDFWAVLLDANGNKLNDFVYGGDGGEYLASVIALPGGGFLIGGSTDSDSTGDVSQHLHSALRDYWMIRLDAAGNKVWDHLYGGSHTDECKHIARTSDGGFILAGYTLSPMDGDVSESPVGIRDYWVVRTDSMGNKLWDKRYGGDAGSQSFGGWAEEAPGGGFWVAGHTSSNVPGGNVSQPSYGLSDYWVLRVDTIGNPLWDKRFGGSGDETFGNLVILPQDSSVVLCGHSDAGSSAVKTDSSKGGLDYWTVRFRYSTPVGIGEGPSAGHVSVSPNPGTGLFHVSLPAVPAGEVRIIAYDIAGQAVFQSRQQAFSREIPIDLGSLVNGYYVLQIFSEGAIMTAPVVKH